MQTTDTLGEVHPNPPIIHQHILHLEVRALGVVLLVKLDERILQRIARLLILDHFARENLAKARKDELQIVAASHRVELTHEEDVFGRANFGKWQIADHLEREGCSIGVGVAATLLLFGVVFLFGEVLVIGESERTDL